MNRIRTVLAALSIIMASVLGITACTNATPNPTTDAPDLAYINAQTGKITKVVYSPDIVDYENNFSESDIEVVLPRFIKYVSRDLPLVLPPELNVTATAELPSFAWEWRRDAHAQIEIINATALSAQGTKEALEKQGVDILAESLMASKLKVAKFPAAELTILEPGTESTSLGQYVVTCTSSRQRFDVANRDAILSAAASLPEGQYVNFKFTEYEYRPTPPGTKDDLEIDVTKPCVVSVAEPDHGPNEYDESPTRSTDNRFYDSSDINYYRPGEPGNN